MRQKLLITAIAATLCHSTPVLADSETEAIKQELDALKKTYGQAITALEERLRKAETNAQQANDKAEKIAVKLEQRNTSATAAPVQNSFNPAISLILDGRFASFDNDPEDYELPGFALGNEAGLGEKGLSIGHSELIMSANIDDKFFGQMTLAFAEHDGETETELEEAFIQTLGLGNGLTIKAGRFLSAISYLNQQHTHVWNFADAPLIYRGLFGDQLIDDGVQMTWIAPTDTFLELGAELLSGSRYPSSGSTNGIGAWTAFTNIGGDIGIEHSWQLGLSHWQADDIEGRESGGHMHGDEAAETPSFSGKSKIDALSMVYKWAPNGSSQNQHLTLQFEYFERKENGDVSMLGSGSPLEMSTYAGHQEGWYAQAVYKFKPQWQAGFRYDWLDSNNRGSDADVLAEAGLDNEGLNPQRYSATLEWLPSEFSRLRLQYNQDESYEKTDHQLFLQYTMSLGSHGAHQF
ncbi:MAG: outer membrane beta-barrel protein [Gammaproteobacteria bacterium]|nr:outer membrane beta-barrel protein [Gammaproteobacteria bacterium]MBQ0840996.1 outer membrane beta-barrel protein [Gammaproteobacteria bacterium]